MNLLQVRVAKADHVSTAHEDKAERNPSLDGWRGVAGWRRRDHR
ncbi:MAG TPA: hypothetical protein VGM02_12420 [Acidobacteriaceae bacterium]